MESFSSIKYEVIVDLYRAMLLIRYFEEMVEYGFSRNQIHGTTHLSIGQEAIPAGICANLSNDDYVVSTHRGHGHALCKQLAPKRLMAEIMGKAEGYCKGKGGTQHVAYMATGFLGTTGITGGGIPIATGAAFTIKYKGRKNISVCFFGDGAVNQGTFHESLNMASIWKLPVLYVCENNHYAMSTSAETMVSGSSIADKAKAYGIDGFRVNGMDVIEVYQTSKDAIKKVRDGGGPILLECETYRFLGHSKSDPRIYRSRDEEESWKRRCPIKNLRRRLISEYGLTEAALEDMEYQLKTEIKDAYDEALKMDVLPEDQILKDLFYDQ